MHKFTSSLISIGLLLLLSFGIFSCGGKKEVKEETAKPSLFKKEKVQEGVVTVTALRVASREVPLSLTTDGTTESSERFEVKAPGPVKVQRVFVEEGQQVASGDPLLRYDDELTELKLEVARAEVKEAEEALALGGHEEEALPEIAVGEEVEEAPAEGETEKPANAAPADKSDLYQAQLDRARAQVELLERSLEVGQINSSIAGTVTKLGAQEGVEVKEDQVLMEIVQIDPIDFVFTSPVDMLSYLERDAEIAVSFSQFPGRTFGGEVAVIGTEAATTEGRVEVRLRIPNEERLLRAGLTGSITVRTPGRKKVLAIPETALVRPEKTAYVFKIEGNRVRKIAVEVQPLGGGEVSVTKGLVGGDTIVASVRGGIATLADGGEVEVETGEVRTEK